MSSPGQGALWEPRPRFLSGTSLQRCHRSWPGVPSPIVATGFGLGRGCFGREGVQSCTGSFPEPGGACLPKLWGWSCGDRPRIQPSATSSNRWMWRLSAPPSATGQSPRSLVVQRISISWCATARRCGARSSPHLAAAPPMASGRLRLHCPGDPVFGRPGRGNQPGLLRHR